MLRALPLTSLPLTCCVLLGLLRGAAPAQEAALAQEAAPAQEAAQPASPAAELGPDYALQGEYVGNVRLPGAGVRQYGLQVVALGENAFQAAGLLGGLPGSGWDRSTRTRLEGLAENQRVVLAGELLPGLRGSMIVEPERVWVHDLQGRLVGQLVKVARMSYTLGLQPPPEAIVLFRPAGPQFLEKAEVNGEGLLRAGAITSFPVADFYLHLEFRTPFTPAARGQGRGNSGVYIQQRYEVQILDSFGLTGVANECGALYRQRPPRVNMALPPLSWQTYDIHFCAARWDACGNKIQNARITVLHNGIPIHSSVDLPTKTGAGRDESPEWRPIQLQHHGDDVVFRNVWIVLK